MAGDVADTRKLLFEVGLISKDDASDVKKLKDTVVGAQSEILKAQQDAQAEFKRMQAERQTISASTNAAILQNWKATQSAMTQPSAAAAATGGGGGGSASYTGSSYSGGGSSRGSRGGGASFSQTDDAMAAIEAQEKAEENLGKVREQGKDKFVDSMGHMTEAVGRLGRSMVLLGLANSDQKDKMLETVASWESAVQMAHGVRIAVDGMRSAREAFEKVQAASAAADLARQVHQSVTAGELPGFAGMSGTMGKQAVENAGMVGRPESVMKSLISLMSPWGLAIAGVTAALGGLLLYIRMASEEEKKRAEQEKETAQHVKEYGAQIQAEAQRQAAISKEEREFSKMEGGYKTRGAVSDRRSAVRGHGNRIEDYVGADTEANAINARKDVELAKQHQAEAQAAIDKATTDRETQIAQIEKDRQQGIRDVKQNKYRTTTSDGKPLNRAGEKFEDVENVANERKQKAAEGEAKQIEAGRQQQAAADKEALSAIAAQERAEMDLRKEAMQTVLEQVKGQLAIRDAAIKTAEQAANTQRSYEEKFGTMTGAQQKRTLRLQDKVANGEKLNPEEEKFLAEHGNDLAQARVRELRIRRGQAAGATSPLAQQQQEQAEADAKRANDEAKRIPGRAQDAGVIPEGVNVNVSIPTIVHKLEILIKQETDQIDGRIQRAIDEALRKVKQDIEQANGRQFGMNRQRQSSMVG